MDKMCANFYELINEQKLTNRQANGVRTFCQESIGGIARFLPSVARLRTQCDERAQAETDAIREKIAGFQHLYELNIPLDADQQFHGADGRKDVQLCYNDMVGAACMLIEKNVRKHEDFLWHHDVKTCPEDGSRLYTPNFDSSRLWQETDEYYFGSREYNLDGRHVILWFIIFIDATVVVTRGTQQCKPVWITLANFPERIRNSNAAWTMIAVLPKLFTTVGLKQTLAFREAKRYVYHTCIEQLFESMVELHAHKGFYFHILGRVRRCVPAIALFMQDNEEGNGLAGHAANVNSAEPCRCCDCAGAEMNNPDAKFKPRNQAETIQFLMPIIDILKRRLIGTVGRARDLAKSRSLVAAVNPCWKLPYGACSGGVFLATPPRVTSHVPTGDRKESRGHGMHHGQDTTSGEGC
jgi:hypothetical protein